MRRRSLVAVVFRFALQLLQLQQRRFQRIP
jgi:hypothetical protein